MTGPAVVETFEPPPPTKEKPNIVLHSDILAKGFETAAKFGRRKAAWFFVRTNDGRKVKLEHPGEEPHVLTSGYNDKDKLTTFLDDNLMPLWGSLDADTWDKYLETGKGII